MENEKLPVSPDAEVPEIIPDEAVPVLPEETAPEIPTEMPEESAENIVEEALAEADTVSEEVISEADEVILPPMPVETVTGDEDLDKRIFSLLSPNPDDEDLLPGERSLPAEEAVEEMPQLDIHSLYLPEDGDEPEEPVQKRRPARKSGYGFFGIPHLITTVVWLLLVAAIGISLGRLAWVCASDVLAFGRENHAVTITITDADTLEDIANKLHMGGLIRYPKLFIQYAKLAKVEEKEKISTGTFTLNTLYDYHALVSAMGSYSDARETVDVTIPEGYTCKQIFRLLEEKGVCSYDELMEYAAIGRLDDYWFLKGIRRGSDNCLEGFLFPDSYQFYIDDEPRRVIEKMLDAFDYRFSDRMHEQIVELNERLAEMMRENGYDEEYIANNYYDIRKIITVASLIEKESVGIVESYTISSVFYNRLTNLNEYPYLNSDAALYYALGGASEHELTAADLEMDSPYNTYTHMGLIPGPIANPGRDSIYAALDPDETNYHFFIYNKEEGRHHFSETLAEHEAYAATLGD